MKRCVRCDNPIAREDWHCDGCGFTPPTHEGIPLLAPELAAHSDGWDAAFAERLAQDERKHFWFRARNRLIVWALRTYFPNARSFFELGCGTGMVLSAVRETFPAMELTAADGTPENLPTAAKRAEGVAVCQCDGRTLPFEDEFDVVGAFDVIEHITEDTVVLEQIHRALRAGGGLIVTVPQHPWLWSVADDFSYHKRRYTRRELVEKVEAAGFRVLRTTSFVTLLLPVLLVSRARLPKKVEDFDPTTEYRMSPLLSALFYGVLRVEEWLIRLGARLPAGGSLLLVAQRGAGTDTD